MSRVIRQATPTLGDLELTLPERILAFLPVAIPVAAAIALILARLFVGPSGFLYEGALTMLALISYMSASVILVTNLFVRDGLLSRLGLWTLGIGYCFNLSGWMIRWMEAGDAEGWKDGINGAWRYFPLDNLYPLTLGFCAGAAITTLILIRKRKNEFIGAMAMPMVTVILAIAMMLGNEIRTLPPILDSYWRPIHVSIATVGYGVCLVSFGLAFAYLLKDGIRSEAVAIAVTLYGLLIYATVGRFGIPFHGEYGVAIFFSSGSLPVRSILPGVGPLMFVTMLVIVTSLIFFSIDWIRTDEKARRWGWKLFKGAAVLQVLVVVVLFYQVRSAENVAVNIPEREKVAFGEWLVEETDQQAMIPPEQYSAIAQNWIQDKAAGLTVNMKSNPVEFGGLIGLAVALVLVSLFSWKRKELMDAMPQLQTIDSLLYKTVGVAFPLLTLLLITGAVWANESWGRYWGWDSKEVGALVAWMAYAGFLHTRVAHGWRGRRSAYFALLGFVLVIFTWLGVSYLLPGLHSYA